MTVGIMRRGFANGAGDVLANCRVWITVMEGLDAVGVI